MVALIRGSGMVTALMVAAGLAGCVQAVPAPAARQASDREREQAREALAGWSAAVEAAGGTQGFVPVGELTGQVGDWEIDV
jgi:hypothetical protein